MATKASVRPAAPEGMEMIFFYSCSYCGRHVPVVSPTQPAMVQCDACQEYFPIMPVDERSLHYVRLMLANGKAALDPDFT